MIRLPSVITSAKSPLICFTAFTIPIFLIRGSNTAQSLALFSKPQPQGGEIIFGPYPAKPQTDVRFTGRQMRMRATVHRDESGVNDVRIGDMRVLVSGGGRR